jgi:hypothetical protein
MGSYKPLKQSYNNDDLNQLQWVLDTVWFIFQTRYPHRDIAHDDQVKACLRRKLFVYAGAGLNDLEALETNLINSFPLEYDLAQQIEV